ncbi:MAG: hypothetical protein N2316_10720 [Spirochaetes bacterium]|nr:hypothetical protein [Spirochaetota bacterium]
MRFAVLLWLLSILLKLASLRNPLFKSYTKSISFCVAIKTKNNKGRAFTFHRGKVASTRSLREYNAALVFLNAKAGYRVLKEGTQEAAFYAAACGQLRVEGMAIFVQWFNEAVAIALGKGRNYAN